MVFSDPRYFLFFVAAALAWFLLRPETLRKTALLAASWWFYGAWDWRFLLLLVASTIVDYGVGARIALAPDDRARRRWLGVSVIVNLGILGLFKYYDFFAESAAALLRSVGIDASLPLLRAVLPLGISFYTFQSLSYTIDVYRRQIPPARSLLDFALFVAFFPQLVAGPILRASEFLPQLAPPPRSPLGDLRPALALFLIGYVKKACVADNLAPYVDDFFAAPDAYAASDHWLGVWLWQTQLYCDFSGYSDMAIASAALLGFRIPINFDFPYFSRSFPEFWRRWHISLSTWLRDYLYFPMTPRTASEARTATSTLTVFFLCGLWHGAAWHFAAFGLLHGIYVVAHRAWCARVGPSSFAGRAVHFLGIPLMNLALLPSLVLFRADSLPQAFDICAAMLGATAPAPGASSLHPSLWWLLLALAAIHALFYSGLPRRLAARIPRPLIGPLLAMGFAIALFFAASGYQPFVYFQF